MNEGLLSSADVEEMIEWMFANQREEPVYIYVSPKDMYKLRRTVWLGDLYRAYPIPKRKLRKCHMRKLQAQWKAGFERIRQKERAYRAQEKSQMSEMRAQQRKLHSLIVGENEVGDS